MAVRYSKWDVGRRRWPFLTTHFDPFWCCNFGQFLKYSSLDLILLENTRHKAFYQARREGGKGEVFPGSATFGGPDIAQKYWKGVPDGFFLTLKVHKINPPRTRLRRSPRPPNRMVRWYPSPHFVFLDVFGVSISAHTEWGCNSSPRYWFPGPRCGFRRACILLQFWGQHIHYILT